MCPGAPLLIPGLAPGLAAEVPEVVDACDRAVRTLGVADRVLLLCSGPRMCDETFRTQRLSVVHPAGTMLSSALITGTSGPLHFTGRLAGPRGAGSLAGSPAAGPPAGSPAGVGVVVGAALLVRAGIDIPVTAVDLADPTAEAAALLEDARTSADRVGLLVVAEGSASRGDGSPGGGSADADVLDASLAAALAAGDPTALGDAAGIDPASAARLQFTAGPALLAMAELTASRRPHRAELLLAQAPLGVGYLVAVWSWVEKERR